MSMHGCAKAGYVRWMNLVLLFASLFYVLALFVHHVQFDLLSIHFSATGRTRPLLFLALLYGVACAWIGVSARPRAVIAVKERIERDLPWVVFLFSLTAFTVLADARVVNVRQTGADQAHFLAGDEPSYLLICQSVVLDGDVNLWNDARQRGGSLFGYPQAGPHKARVDVERECAYSVHSPGLPFILSPFFSLALETGLTPRFVCVSVLNILAALLAVVMFGLAARTCGGRWPAFAATLAAVSSSPLLIYASQIYPELAGALLTASAFALLRRAEARDAKADVMTGGAIGLCMACLPWLHIRLGVFSAGILASLMLLEWRRARLLLAALLPAAISAVALMLCYQRWYGSPLPNAAYASQGWSATMDLTPSGLLRNMVGLFADNGVGLLPWAPCYAFVPAGIWFAFRRHPATTAVMLSTSLLYLVVIASFRDWFGGFCPANRFMVTAVPFLVVWLACFVKHTPRRETIVVFAVLMLLSVFLTCRAAYGHYDDLYSKRHILQTAPLAGGFMSDYFTDSILRRSPGALRNGVLLLSLVSVVNLYAVLPRRRRK